jgi:anti-sigma28 factor (negative regulator of flagellin synthesis)
MDCETYGLSIRLEGSRPRRPITTFSLVVRGCLNMKISDQGFTERLTSPTARSGNATEVARSGSAAKTGNSSSPDSVQLSTVASQLQNTSATDSARSTRVSQIAQAVRNNTFQVNPAQISGALVSEAIQPSAR